MNFFPLILASIFAAAATTALPHDNLLNGLSLRQDSSCAAAMSSEEAAREKYYAAVTRYEESPSPENKDQAYKAKIDLQGAQNQVVSVVVLLN